jgi:hypothetical protein
LAFASTASAQDRGRVNGIVGVTFQSESDLVLGILWDFDAEIRL